VATAHHQPSSGGVMRDLWMLARYHVVHIDRPAWRRFFLALFGLSLAFFLALYSAALNFSGRHKLGATCAALSLLLTGIVAVKVVPYLARRTALERWMVKVEYDFTREGAVYLMVIAVIIVAALNTGNNLLFIILASLLAGILASGILSHIMISGLELDFALPDHLFAGQPMISRLTVRNLKWFFPSFSVSVAAADPARSRRKQVLRAASRAILEHPIYVPYVPRRASVTQHVDLTFPHRGRYTQEGFRVSTKFPFGFLRKTRDVPAQHELLVLPSVEPTEEFFEILPFLSGEVESFYKGRGHDLYSIRDYQESDSARHVDWKATARAQALKVREFTREDERRVTLVFDARLPRADEKTLAQFEKAVSFGACLAWHFYEIDAQIEFLSEGFESSMAPAQEVVYPILEALALAEPQVGPAPPGAPGLLKRLSASPSGFNIILTCQPRGSVPTWLWGSSYLVFIDAL
jgi:uncharacterized protein (DUF58 family)